MNNNCIHLVEHPKCGRTWLYYMMEYAIKKHYSETPDSINIPWVRRTHHGMAIKHRKDEYTKKESFDKKEKTIFLVRDPRDVIVSFYFQAKHRTKKKFFEDKGISNFIRSKWGIKQLLLFYRDWVEILEKQDNCIMIRYENLQLQCEKELRKIFNFLDINISDEIMKETIEHHKFNKMKKREIKNSLSKNPEMLKTRKGKIGGYKDYLNKKDIEFMNKMMIKYNSEITKEYVNGV